VDVAGVIESCIHIAGNQIRHRAVLERDLAEVPPVLGNPARISQVVLNLLANAAKAIPDGNPGAHRVRVRARRAPDARVVLEVSDTGEGIRPEHLSRIFDPFFTTKPVGVGTGLGLSVCHNIVTSYGGEIRVESERGRGSTFRVFLLSAEGSASSIDTAPAPGHTSAARRGRILVVDDEPLVGAALRRALVNEHDVEVTASAVEALTRIGGGERFDLVLSDLLMPEMTGMDLHGALSVQAPEIVARMMFLTGGAFTPAARRFADEHRDVCIDKPFDVFALRDLIRRRIAELGAAPRS
jgi:CheY-like chemotaxis protein